VIDLKKTVDLSAERELEEEVYFPEMVEQFTIKTQGYIIDSGDEVGQVHIGVWQNLVLPSSVDHTLIDIGENERHKMQMLGFFTPDELKEKAKTLNMENWTKIIIDNL
jgi:predicted NUDIX family phosphoesterase